MYDWKNTYSWILSVIERSVLNQDYRIPNQTATVVEANQPNLCEPFAKRVIEVKNVCISIQIY